MMWISRQVFDTQHYLPKMRQDANNGATMNIIANENVFEPIIEFPKKKVIT
jgi:hypothetical protein